MAGYMDVGAAIKTAESLLDKKRQLLQQIDTVRTDLRNAATRNEGTPEQRQWIETHFPIRERKKKSKPAAVAAR